VYLRLSASEKLITNVIEGLSKKQTIETLDNSEQFWSDIRDHKHHFFGRTDKPLWRLSLTPAAEEIKQINDNQFIEWGGSQRWVNTNTPANIVHNSANSRKGYATLFRSEIPNSSNFPKLDENLMKLHKHLKNNMDPHGVFNPGRIYPDL